MRIRRNQKNNVIALVVCVCLMLAACSENSMSLDLSETEAVRSISEEETAQEQSEEETESLPIAELNINEDETEKKTILVHVCGAVGYSDVYELEEGSRVVDAVRKAGGFNEAAASNYLNLADVVYDGMKIYIPTVKEVEEGNVPETIVTASSTELVRGDSANDDTGQKEQTGSKVNINTAAAQQLMTLSGIGEKRANDIVQYREANGCFNSIEEIKNVTGIGDSIYNNICNDIEV